jgi:hypothetical protein
MHQHLYESILKNNQILLLYEQSLDLRVLENNGKKDASYQVFV